MGQSGGLPAGRGSVVVRTVWFKPLACRDLARVFESDQIWRASEHAAPRSEDAR